MRIVAERVTLSLNVNAGHMLSPSHSPYQFSWSNRCRKDAM